MGLPEGLRKLLVAPGPSGAEAPAAAVWRELAESFATEVRGDLLGSSSAVVPARADGGLRVAVVGHIDQIGLIVTHVDDEGMLWFDQVGGWDPVVLVAQRVEVQTKDGPVPGVIGRKPPHLSEPDEREKAPKVKALHVDIGAKDRDDALARVRVGDVVVIEGAPLELPNDRVASRALDNRLGCWIALEAARLVSEAGGAAGDVLALAVVAEETGPLAGASTSAYALQPDVALVVDVGHATDVPDVEERTQGRHPLGSGAIVGRSPVAHPAVVEGLLKAAEADDIAFTLQADGRQTWTDADAIHLSRAGIPTANVSIPLRYMHSPVEICQLSDVEACARLCAAYALRLAAGTSLVR